MKLTIPAPAEGAPSTEDNEVAWHRELKQLRVRVGQLEAEKGLKQAPSIDTKRGEHGIQCGHPCGVYVIDNEPRVECQACGADLDPVDVLRNYAKHERNFCYTLEHLRKEREALAIEVDKLKKLRSRLRSDARKLMPPVPPRPGENNWERVMHADQALDRELAKKP